MTIFLALLAAAAPTAEPALSSYDPQTIVAFLQGQGYRAKLDPNRDGKDQTVGPWIETSDGGSKITISFLSCENKKRCEDLSFTSAWDFGDRKGPTAEPLQRWNAQKRFTKAYLDSVGDPVLEMDVLFTNGKLDRQGFSNALNIFTSAVSQFEGEIGWTEKAQDPAGGTTASR